MWYLYRVEKRLQLYSVLVQWLLPRLTDPVCKQYWLLDAGRLFGLSGLGIGEWVHVCGQIWGDCDQFHKVANISLISIKYIDIGIAIRICDLVQDCSISSALTIERLQSCTMPSICNNDYPRTFLTDWEARNDYDYLNREMILIGTYCGAPERNAHWIRHWLRLNNMDKMSEFSQSHQDAKNGSCGWHSHSTAPFVIFFIEMNTQLNRLTECATSLESYTCVILLI